MARPRFKNLNAEKQRLILDTAAEVFADNGFEKSSYNTIIERCGLSKGVMYYYFDDKRDLFNTILEEANSSFVGFVGEWQTPSTKEGYWAQVADLFDRSMEFFEQDPRAARLLRMATKSPDVLTETYKSFEQEAAFWFGSALAEGQELGAIRKDLPMDLLVCMVFGIGQASDYWMLSRWETSDRDSRQEDSRLLFRVFKEFFQPPQLSS